MADSFSPPADVRANAKRGLELREEHGRGGTAVGVARARDLSNGSNISLDTIKRMSSYFARHEVDKKGEGWGKDSAGYIAWLLWGGDAGKRWVASILREEEKKDKMTNLAHSYAAITKADKNPDGTLTVYGKATDSSVDIDQQICDEAWLRRAMPDWMMSGGNIREQHDNIAAGVATDYELKQDGHYITALVVDPVSVKKVETGVLKGFSIGIRGPRVIRDEKAAGGRIIDGQIVEVSLVDRPANPNAKLMLAKAAESGELMAIEQKNAPLPSDVFKNTKAGDPVSDKAADLLNLAKGLLKFDQATFDRARTELSNLIGIEAGEMASGGHDESVSLTHLLEAIRHLFAWYEGEEAEGEVAPAEGEVAPEVEVEIEEDVELDAEMALEEDKPEAKPGEEEPQPEKAKCEKCEKELDPFAGDKPDDKKCQKCMKEAEMAAEGSEEDAPKSARVVVGDSQIASIVNKAVAQAKASVKEELETLASALEAERVEKAQLADELATAKKAVVGGGPSRTGAINKSETQVNALLVKAAEYSLKAEQTSDRDLAKGYRELAVELRAKASGKDVN